MYITDIGINIPHAKYQSYWLEKSVYPAGTKLHNTLQANIKILNQHIKLVKQAFRGNLSSLFIQQNFFFFQLKANVVCILFINFLYE